MHFLRTTLFLFCSPVSKRTLNRPFCSTKSSGAVHTAWQPTRVRFISCAPKVVKFIPLPRLQKKPSQFTHLQCLTMKTSFWRKLLVTISRNKRNKNFKIFRQIEAIEVLMKDLQKMMSANFPDFSSLFLNFWELAYFDKVSIFGSHKSLKVMFQLTKANQGNQVSNDHLAVKLRLRNMIATT